VSGGPANWCASSQIYLFWACVLRSARLTAGSCWRAEGGVLMRLSAHRGTSRTWLAWLAAFVPGLASCGGQPCVGGAGGQRFGGVPPGAHSPSARCLHHGCGGYRLWARCRTYMSMRHAFAWTWPQAGRP